MLSIYRKFYIVFCVWSPYFIHGFTEYEGDHCKNNDGQKGICRLQTDCPETDTQIEEMGFHMFHRCGFKRDIEIVCCPVTTSTTTKKRWLGKPITTRRKSEKACDTYTDNNFITEDVNTVAPVGASDEDKNVRIPLVAHGEDANPKEYKSMAALEMYKPDTGEYLFQCGATLISKKHLLTAAHCLSTPDGLVPKIVRMGIVEIPELITNLDLQLDHKIKNYTAHPNFTRSAGSNDIAVLELEKPVIFTDYVRPACLHTTNNLSKEFIILGWGKTEYSGRSDILQWAFVNLVPYEICSFRYLRTYNQRITENEICAIGNTTDICTGDSGGPLLQLDNPPVSVLVGISIRGGSKCGQTFVPSMYTKISKYLDWIETIVWP